MLPMRRHKPSRSRPCRHDFHFEIVFFEGVTRRDPDFIEALQVLGDAYTKTGQWRKGLQVDLRLAKLCPNNPLVYYNLACSYSLLHQPDAAFDALDHAIKLGYRDIRWLNKDPDLANLRHDDRFEKIRAEISKAL